MGFFDFFMRDKTWLERGRDIVTKGDFSSKAVDGRKVAAGVVVGGVWGGAKVAGDISHGQSYQQDQAARDKNGK